jgi:hypothetical protein
MIQIQFILGIFFLYLTILGGGIQDLFSCELQRQLKNSIIFKHILVIVTVYFFTFVLGWFTTGALKSARDQQMVETFQDKDTKDDTLLIRYALYTLGIYCLFLLSTKCEFIFLMIVFAMVVVILGFYLRRLYRDEEEIQKYRNVEMTLEYSSIVLLVIGFGLYFIRQYRDHAKEWNTFTFIFGSNKCRNL